MAAVVPMVVILGPWVAPLTYGQRGSIWLGLCFTFMCVSGLGLVLALLFTSGTQDWAESGWGVVFLCVKVAAAVWAALILYTALAFLVVDRYLRREWDEAEPQRPQS